MKRFRKIGNYEISNECLQCYPCKHSVKFDNGEVKLMYGDDIYRLFQSEGLRDPHINSYAEWVRQCDFPISEETQEQQQGDQQETMIHQYKASSRLKKLKSKNNII
jgi:hypothetical protein